MVQPHASARLCLCATADTGALLGPLCRVRCRRRRNETARGTALLVKGGHTRPPLLSIQQEQSRASAAHRRADERSTEWFKQPWPSKRCTFVGPCSVRLEKNCRSIILCVLCVGQLLDILCLARNWSRSAHERCEIRQHEKAARDDTQPCRSRQNQIHHKSCIQTCGPASDAATAGQTSKGCRRARETATERRHDDALTSRPRLRPRAARCGLCRSACSA